MNKASSQVRFTTWKRPSAPSFTFVERNPSEWWPRRNGYAPLRLRRTNELPDSDSIILTRAHPVARVYPVVRPDEILAESSDAGPPDSLIRVEAMDAVPAGDRDAFRVPSAVTVLGPARRPQAALG